MVSRLARLAALTSFAGLIAIHPAQASTHFSIQIGVPAPVVVAAPAPVYATPVAVAPGGYVWQAGYWIATPYGQQWVPGAWVPRAYHGWGHERWERRGWGHERLEHRGYEHDRGRHNGWRR